MPSRRARLRHATQPGRWPEQARSAGRPAPAEGAGGGRAPGCRKSFRAQRPPSARPSTTRGWGAAGLAP
eukprot:14159298-Alexandrium_andersonii.AAC.1